MKTITCLKELKERKELQYEDEVTFTIEEKILKYKTHPKLLYIIDNNFTTYNSKVFDILEIDKTKKHEMAAKAYGYKSKTGLWPETKTGDYAALTRLVKEIYIKIEGPPPESEPDPILSRFEILDL